MSITDLMANDPVGVIAVVVVAAIFLFIGFSFLKGGSSTSTDHRPGGGYRPHSPRQAAMVRFDPVSLDVAENFGLGPSTRLNTNLFD